MMGRTDTGEEGTHGAITALSTSHSQGTNHVGDPMYEGLIYPPLNPLRSVLMLPHLSDEEAACPGSRKPQMELG